MSRDFSGHTSVVGERLSRQVPRRTRGRVLRRAANEALSRYAVEPLERRVLLTLIVELTPESDTGFRAVRARM